MTGPGTLDALRAIKDPEQQAQAVKLYISERERAIMDARKIRNAAIAVLLKSHGIADTARRCGVSESLVKMVKMGKA